jgi:4-amino-4-deoxy-L-arabinose transferase-like glycosyltransferase
LIGELYPFRSFNQQSIINHQFTYDACSSRNPSMTNRTRTDSLLLAGFCAFLFLYGLGQFGLIGADEPRYAQVAREMLERHDWITPVLGGRPWLEKPPLYYWQAMLSYSVFSVSDWAARLPSTLDATLLVLAVYFFLRRFRPGFELDGALITASSAGIVGYARAASTDMALAATFGIGMLGWWAWRESGKSIYLAAFYGCMALGTLAKGPVAPFLAAAVIILYAIVVRELRLVLKSLWLPGIALFCAVALPWYVVVQMRNPEFFREFIVHQNLGRFSENLYHHVEPFWYYLPVTALALAPWTVFVIAALVQAVQLWWAPRRPEDAARTDFEKEFSIFACCWLVVPVVFFSISQSKLPGYILPAIPAGALVLVDYLRQHLEQSEGKPPATWLVALHALLAATPIVPALLIAYLVTQHRLPAGQPMLVAIGIAFVLCAGIALTLVRTRGLRMLRFVTVIPVLLVVGVVLRLGSVALDQTYTARPLAIEIARMETRPLRLAVYHVRRELEYGLTFYRNRLTFNYDWGSVPQEEHLLVAPENSQLEIAKLVAGRRVSYLGHYAAQHVDFFWVAAVGAGPAH